MNNFKTLLLISAALLLGLNEVGAVKDFPTEEGSELSTQASKKTPTTSQKKSSKKERASKKKDSSQTYSIKGPEDLCYRDDDISDYLKNFIRQNDSFKYLDNHSYLLSGQTSTFSPIVDETHQEGYIVAVTPAIDIRKLAERNSDTNLCYVLNKNLYPKGPLEVNLEELLRFIEDPSHTYDNLLEKISGFRSDENRCEVIDELLQDKEGNIQAIKACFQERLADEQKKDVFEEVMPRLQAPENSHVRILFPYNTSQIHWLTGEILIHKSQQNQYDIEVYAHNPYGMGKIEESVFDQLRAVIEARVQNCAPHSHINFIQNPESPYGQRQAKGDVISCGVIVADDLIKRITGAPIGNVIYPVNALELRGSQLKCVRKSNPNSTFVTRNQARIIYIGKEEKSKNQSKGKGASSDPLPKKNQVSPVKATSQEEVKKTYTFSPTTIKICPKNLEELRVQKRKDCTVRDGCAYDSCYGRNMIFDVHNEPTRWRSSMVFYVHNKLTKWRKAALERVQKFSDEIEQFTLQNFVVASLKLKAIDLSLSQRLNLPYVFFSGNPGEIERNISLTETEANNKNLPSSLPKSIQEKIKTLLKENNITFIANKYFHVEAPPFFATPLGEPLFVFRSNEKSSVLNFRKFIYSHFITEEEWTQISSPFDQFKPIIKNLVTYSDGCSSYLSSKEDSDSSKKQQTKKKQHSAEKEDPAVRAYNFILELALAENYIAQEKEDLIQAVFNERPTDLFDAGKHDKSKSSGDRKLGMSFCFHQSEQSLLLYLLKESPPEILSDFQSKLANFIIEHVSDNFSAYSRFLRRETIAENPPSTDNVANSAYLDAEDFKDANLQPKPDSLSIITTGVDENSMSDEEIVKDEDLGIQEFTDAGLKKKSVSADDGIISSSTSSKEVIFKIDTNFDINLDIISPRHICKFCRGTFYLCQDKISLFLNTFLTNEGITLDNKTPLHQKISSLQQDSLMDALLKLKLSEIKVNIFATSYKDVDNPDLLGILK